MCEESLEAGLKIRQAHKSAGNAHYLLSQPSSCEAPPFPLQFFIIIIVAVLSGWQALSRICFGPAYISAEFNQVWPLGA